MPSDDTFEFAWQTVTDDDLHKGFMSDFRNARRAKQSEVAARRHAARVRGEALMHQLRYGVPPPTEAPPGPPPDDGGPPPDDGDDGDDGDAPPPSPPSDDALPPEAPFHSTEERRLVEEALPPVEDAVPEPKPKKVELPPPEKKAKKAKVKDIVKPKAKEVASKPPVPTNESEIEGFEASREARTGKAPKATSNPPEQESDAMVSVMADPLGAAKITGEVSMSEAIQMEQAGKGHMQTLGDGTTEFYVGIDKDHQPISGDVSDDEEGFELPSRNLTGRGKGEAQTQLFGDAMMALEAHGLDQKIPVLDARGNPKKVKKKDDWHIRWNSELESPEYFSLSDPQVSITPEKFEPHSLGKRSFGGPKSNWFPGPESKAIKVKTGEVVKSPFVLKNPFANPFDNPSAFELSEEMPTQQRYESPIIKSDPPQEAPDIGFEVKAGDDLSLLPASLFAKDSAPGGDDLSLLPSGWKSGE